MVRYLSGLAVGLGCFLWCAPAVAQQGGVAVQLPTFSYFGVSTTISVPDSGGAYLGGMNRRESGHNAYGPELPLRSSAAGTNTAGSRLHVSAAIHDFQEMDALILGQARRQPRAPQAGFAWKLRQAQETSARHVPRSVAAIRRQRAVEQEAEQQAGLSLLERGRQAESEGKPGVAKIYYQMAARRLRGAEQDQAQDRLATLADTSEDRP